jgi:PadR family transcriptional regulator AphA
MPRRTERLLPAAYALLGLLAEGPAHGYDLHRAFVAGTPLGDVYRLEINQLYALLKKLAELGLVAQTGVAPVGNTPPRRYFAITAPGLAELNTWLREPVPHTREVRLEFLVKLYFAARRGPADARTLLHAQLRLTRQTLRHLEEQGSKAPLPPTDFRRLVLDLRIRQNQAVLIWLEETLRADPAAWIPGAPGELRPDQESHSQSS